MFPIGRQDVICVPIRPATAIWFGLEGDIKICRILVSYVPSKPYSVIPNVSDGTADVVDVVYANV